MKDGLYKTLDGVQYEVIGGVIQIKLGAYSVDEALSVTVDWIKQVQDATNRRIDKIEENNWIALNRLLDRGGL